MAAEATAGAAAWVEAATLAAGAVVSAEVADRTVADIEVVTAGPMEAAPAEGMGAATTAEQAILAGTQGEAPTAAMAPAAPLLLAPGPGKDTAAPATLPRVGTALTVVHPLDPAEQMLPAGRVTHRLELAQEAQISLLIRWPPMATGTRLDRTQHWLPTPTQPELRRSITPQS